MSEQKKGKNANKNLRQPVGDQETVNKKSDTEKTRPVIGFNSTFDADHYVNLPEYQGMRFRWADFQDGTGGTRAERGIGQRSVGCD